MNSWSDNVWGPYLCATPLDDSLSKWTVVGCQCRYWLKSIFFSTHLFIHYSLKDKINRSNESSPAPPPHPLRNSYPKGSWRKMESNISEIILPSSILNSICSAVSCGSLSEVKLALGNYINRKTVNLFHPVLYIHQSHCKSFLSEYNHLLVSYCSACGWHAFILLSALCDLVCKKSETRDWGVIPFIHLLKINKVKAYHFFTEVPGWSSLLYIFEFLFFYCLSDGER